jgi:tRNA threonylcarbamoyl adenosine modification protein YeaZ
MKTLALEFSSSHRSVAVLDGDVVLAGQSEAAGQNFPPLRLIEQALQSAGVERGQIECLAVGLGPGSYNGIRSAIALAQGWQLAGGVSSMECLAAQAQAEKVFGRVNVIVDAQRNEFYVAGYEICDKSLKCTSELRIVTLPELQSPAFGDNLTVGPEITRWFPAGRILLPTATALGRLAAVRSDFVSGEQLEPIYLRATTFVKAPPARTI